MLLRKVKLLSISQVLSLICTLLIAPTSIANPFEGVGGVQNVEAYKCVSQKAQAIIKIIKPIKPKGCRVSATHTGNKVIYSCKDLEGLKALKQSLQYADVGAQTLKVKISWIAIQANKAQDLLKLLDRKDCNLKSLWGILINDYITKGFAQTLASPEVLTVVGSPFSFQTQECFKKDIVVKVGKNKFVKKLLSSDIMLSMKGYISELSNGRFVLSLETKQQTQLLDQKESPQCHQSLVTELLLEKGKIVQIGGVYHMKTHEIENGGIISKALPWLDNTYKTSEKSQQFVSTVFVELIDSS